MFTPASVRCMLVLCGVGCVGPAAMLSGEPSGYHTGTPGLALGAAHWLDGPEPPKDGGKVSDPKYVLDFTLKSIDGKDVDLAQYKGKVVLIVNVASKCGYTPQYEGLQALYASRKDKGLVILGFPANNFGAQEPGTNEDIATFCASKYSVTFPLFAKISVKGDDQHPLFKRLAALPPPLGGDPKWNFTKFLVDRDGRVQYRFEPKARPTDKPDEKDEAAKDLLAKVDQLLAQSPAKAEATPPTKSGG